MLVQTKSGAVKGVHLNDWVNAWLGIPFAEPPLGKVGDFDRQAILLNIFQFFRSKFAQLLLLPIAEIKMPLLVKGDSHSSGRICNFCCFWRLSNSLCEQKKQILSFNGTVFTLFRASQCLQ